MENEKPKRPYGGRKVVTDKKIPVQVYVPKSVVKKFGTVEKARIWVINALESYKK